MTDLQGRLDAMAESECRLAAQREGGEMNRCALGFHKWGRWSAPFAGHDGDAYQQRRCLLCNRAHSLKINGGFFGFGASRVPTPMQEDSHDR